MQEEVRSGIERMGLAEPTVGQRLFVRSLDMVEKCKVEDHECRHHRCVDQRVGGVGAWCTNNSKTLGVYERHARNVLTVGCATVACFGGDPATTTAIRRRGTVLLLLRRTSRRKSSRRLWGGAKVPIHSLLKSTAKELKGFANISSIEMGDGRIVEICCCLVHD